MTRIRSHLGDRPADEGERWSATAKEAFVLAVLTRRVSTAQIAAAADVAEADIAAWTRRFVKAGEDGLRRRGRPHPTSADDRAAPADRSDGGLADENWTLRTALAEMCERTELWRAAADDTLGPSATLR